MVASSTVAIVVVEIVWLESVLLIAIVHMEWSGVQIGLVEILLDWHRVEARLGVLWRSGWLEG